MSARSGLLALLLLAGCGDAPAGGPGPCGVPPDPGPMSAQRAAVLAPDVLTGLAVSATHLTGDCRPVPEGATPPDICGDPLCRRARAPLEVLVVGANVSVPLATRCGGAPEAEALRGLAAGQGVASALGELVLALEPGVYQPYLVATDGCAPCGDPGEGTCLVTVEADAVAARDLVLDEAAH